MVRSLKNPFNAQVVRLVTSSIWPASFSDLFTGMHEFYKECRETCMENASRNVHIFLIGISVHGSSLS